jgi:hypothetical protein
MITEKDLNSAIAECQGKRNPDARTCIMLAAFYTIRREMFGEEKEAEHSYSYAPAPTTIVVDGDSEFARIVNGRDQSQVMPVMVELMDTLNVIQPRLYDAVLDRLA